MFRWGASKGAKPKVDKSKSKLGSKIGKRSFDDGIKRRRGKPVEDDFDLVTMLRVELDGRRVGAYVLRKGENSYQVRFGFDCRGIHPSLRANQIDNVFDPLEMGLKDLPERETLTIHLSSFTSDEHRQRQLDKLIDLAPSPELQFLLKGESDRIRELTEQGIRKPKTLHLFVSYTVEPEAIESSDIIEKLLAKLTKFWKSFTGELEKLQYMEIERLMSRAYLDGFRQWERLLSNKMGLDVRALSDTELWEILWYRFNSIPAIDIPQTLILDEDGLREEVYSELSPLTLLMAESTPVADRQWVHAKGKYIGVLTFVDKPGGWLNKESQLRYLWDAISRDDVVDTEIVCQLTRANATLARANMQRLTKRAVTMSTVAATKGGTVDVGAGVNLKRAVAAQEALYEGSIPIYTGVTFLVHRDTTRALDEACRLISSLFLRPAWVARDTEYPWLIWTQTFPIRWDKMLFKPFDRRQVYFNGEVPGLMPTVKPRAVDRAGLELISAEGGAPIFIDLYNECKSCGLFGTSRSGKSVLAAAMVSLGLACGMPVIILDYPRPDGTSTFTDYTHFMGERGAYFNVATESCNLFEIPDLSQLSREQKAARFEDYKDFLLGALITMVMGSGESEKKSLSDMVRSLLTLAIDAFFKDEVIRDRYRDAFIQGFASDTWWSMPTLEDFIEFCSYERIKVDGTSASIKEAMTLIQVRLNYWLTSRIGKSISKPSTFRSDAQLLVFALANLSNEEDAAVLSLGAYAAALRRALSSKASVFFIDESPILFRFKSISLLIARLFANGAKSGIRMILSAQDPDSIANSPGGTQIFQNMGLQLVGRIQPTAADSFVKILKYPLEIIARNASESFFPKKESIYSQWLVRTGETFIQTRFYPGFPLLAAVVNNQEEQAQRTAFLNKYPGDKFLAMSEFAKALVANIRSS